MISLYSQIILLEICIVTILHLLSLYFLKKEKKYRRWLIWLLSLIIVFTLIIYCQLRSDKLLLDKFDLSFSIWLLSGFIMTYAIYIKVKIAVRIILRRIKGEYYHYNIFGGKVINQSYVSNSEFKLFLFTIPFFLLPGSYFVARIINWILYGHL